MVEHEVINLNTDLGLLKDVAQAKKAVFEYIEQFYNQHRTHLANDYIPP